MELVKSRIVCKHWKKGNCIKGNTCMFSHVGRQNPMSGTTTETTTKTPTCRNGSSCEWLKKKVCSFHHPRIGVQKPWTTREAVQEGRQGSRQGGRQGGRQLLPCQQLSRNHGKSPSQSDRAVCKFDGRCDRIPNCPYLHYKEDFPPFQGRRNPEVRRNTNQRRN